MAELRLKAVAWRVAAVLAGLFVALQFDRPELTNPPVVADLQAPEPVKQIIKKACYNCHSNETILPWFDQVVPAYWLVVRDVQAGRERLNFSNFGKLPAAKQKALLYESLNQARLGVMPPRAYTRVHPDAVLSTGQLKTLENYLHAPGALAPATDEQRAATARQLATRSSGAPRAAVKPAPNGLPFPVDYANWKPISTTDRFDNRTLRLILGNDVAQRALATNHVHPWPDGSAFAKIAWEQLPLDDGSVQAGEFKQVEFMIKDAAKYAATEGWGFGRWLGASLQPYGKGAGFDRECTGCHAPMVANDFVFTLPISQRGEVSGSPFVNREAALPAGLPFQPFDWRVIATRLEQGDGSMSTLYGNDLAVDHTRSASAAAPYPPGTLLALVVWSPQDDAHWFGGRIPGPVRSIEFVSVTSALGDAPAYAYQAFAGNPPLRVSAPVNESARIAFIVDQPAAFTP
jgi:hypothetical protein